MSQQVTTSFAQMMSYPKDGSRKTGVKAGKVTIDFEGGVVTFSDGTTDTLSSSLQVIGSNFARSAYIFVNDAQAQVKVGGQILPQKQQCIFLLSGLAFDKIEITFPDTTISPNRIPLNDYAFQVMASDAVTLPVSIDNLLTDHTPTTQSGNSVDAYTLTHLFYFKGYSQINVTIQNSAGVNPLTGDIQFSDDGVNWYDIVGYPLNIAINSSNIFNSAVKHTYYRVQVKSQNAGFPTSYVVSVALER